VVGAAAFAGGRRRLGFVGASAGGGFCSGRGFDAAGFDAAGFASGARARRGRGRGSVMSNARPAATSQ
jgi:hypothetical protein